MHPPISETHGSRESLINNLAGRNRPFSASHFRCQTTALSYSLTIFSQGIFHAVMDLWQIRPRVFLLSTFKEIPAHPDPSALGEHGGTPSAGRNKVDEIFIDNTILFKRSIP